MIKTIIFDFYNVLYYPKETKNHLNMELIECLKTIANKINLYIFTSGSVPDSPKYRLILDPIFKYIFTTSKLGFSKIQQNSYDKILQKLELTPSEVLFIDDTEENIKTAKNAGWNVITYNSNVDLFQRLKELNII